MNYIKVYKVRPLDEPKNELLLTELNQVIPEIEKAETGQQFVVEISEMDKSEFESMPEFDGF